MDDEKFKVWMTIRIDCMFRIYLDQLKSSFESIVNKIGALSKIENTNNYFHNCVSDIQHIIISYITYGIPYSRILICIDSLNLAILLYDPPFSRLYGFLK